MALFPVELGAVNESVAEPLPAVALIMAGAPGLAVVTVRTALAGPQVMVTAPALLPAIIVVPLIRAMAISLLLQVPTEAPLGIAVIVDVPAVATEAGFRVMPVNAAAVTVNTALTLPQVIVAVPVVLPAMTVVPLIRATAILLLEQLPSAAPAGIALIVDVPALATVAGVNVIAVSTATGVTLFESAEAGPVPALLVALTVQL